MPAYVARRLAYSIPVLLIASFLLFAFVRATFDPTARLRASRDPNAIQRERERLGLNDPVAVQYKGWLDYFVHGEWGECSPASGRATATLRRAMWGSLQRIGWGVLISAVFGVGLGLCSAVRLHTIAACAFTRFSALRLAMPPFWCALRS